MDQALRHGMVDNPGCCGGESTFSGKHYVSIDGGGSKCFALLFDGQMNLLGKGLSGGVNLTQNTPSHARANIEDCIAQAFSACKPQQVDRLYLNFLGDRAVLEEVISSYAPIMEMCCLGEAQAMLYAGLQRDHGMVALSGTGSDVFFLYSDKHGQPRQHGCGGWGPILGDQGSGAWIGQKALRAVIRSADGWGPDTMLTDMIKSHWQLNNLFDMTSLVYADPAPFQRVASLTPLVGQAAARGDSMALHILRGAGICMARQAEVLVRRLGDALTETEVLCAGGAWKAHDAMFHAFGEELRRRGVPLRPVLPPFEPVAAGVICELLGSGHTGAEARAITARQFLDVVINWPFGLD